MSKAEALAALSLALQGTDLSVSLCLRNKAEASVFLGGLSGQPVIVKQFHSDPQARLARMQAELDLVAAQMAGGPHGINRLLSTRPALGLAVLEHAGVPLRSVEIAEAPMGGAWMRKPGGWLGANFAPRRGFESFPLRHWLERLEAAAPLADPPPVRVRARRHLRQWGRGLAGAPFTRAATHGDFVSINAMWRAGQIVGVDVQGESWLPLARDMARFLVWQEMTDPAPGPRLWGIAEADLTAFTAAPLLEATEAAALLPFFIGLQLLQRLSDMQGDPLALRRGLAALNHWCSAARQA